MHSSLGLYGLIRTYSQSRHLKMYWYLLKQLFSQPQVEVLLIENNYYINNNLKRVVNIILKYLLTFKTISYSIYIFQHNFCYLLIYNFIVIIHITINIDENISMIIKTSIMPFEWCEYVCMVKCCNQDVPFLIHTYFYFFHK